MNSRFGSHSLLQIDENNEDLTPINTQKANKSSWILFETFCKERSYVLDEKTSIPKLADILKDFSFNIKKQDGSNYKEGVIKTQWNRIAKMLQEKYYNEYNISFDPFKDVTFQKARNARDVKRKQLQISKDKRKSSSVSFSSEEHKKMMNLWDEDTPDGLQRKFYHIVSYELAWRGGEAAQCETTFFGEEYDNFGKPTGRIIYDPVFSKTSQGGARPLTEKKYLLENKDDLNRCPVRLFHKLMKKRGKNITTHRLFLTPNPSWNQENSVGFYKNMPIGRNTISKWTSTAAEQIGMDIKRHKITNHSNRSAAVSNLAKSGVGEQQITKITGHSSVASINPYLNLDKDHHNHLITKMRQDVSNPAPERNLTITRPSTSTETQIGDISTRDSTSSYNCYNNCTINYSNCNFNK